MHIDPGGHESDDPIRYDDEPDGEGMRFEARVRLVLDGGQVVAEGQRLRVHGADSAFLVLSAGTSFNGFDRSPGREGRGPSVLALAHLDAAVAKPYGELLDAHIRDHLGGAWLCQHLYHQVLSLPVEPEVDISKSCAAFSNSSTGRGEFRQVGIEKCPQRKSNPRRRLERAVS